MQSVIKQLWRVLSRQLGPDLTKYIMKMSDKIII